MKRRLLASAARGMSENRRRNAWRYRGVCVNISANIAWWRVQYRGNHISISITANGGATWREELVPSWRVSAAGGRQWAMGGGEGGEHQVALVDNVGGGDGVGIAGFLKAKYRASRNMKWWRGEVISCGRRRKKRKSVLAVEA
jgi:hypothetical protein